MGVSGFIMSQKIHVFGTGQLQKTGDSFPTAKIFVWLGEKKCIISSLGLALITYDCV